MLSRPKLFSSVKNSMIKDVWYFNTTDLLFISASNKRPLTWDIPTNALLNFPSTSCVLHVSPVSSSQIWLPYNEISNRSTGTNLCFLENYTTDKVQKLTTLNETQQQQNHHHQNPWYEDVITYIGHHCGCSAVTTATNATATSLHSMALMLNKLQGRAKTGFNWPRIVKSDTVLPHLWWLA